MEKSHLDLELSNNRLRTQLRTDLLVRQQYSDLPIDKVTSNNNFLHNMDFVETRRNLYELCAPQFEIYLYRERTTNEIHSLKDQKRVVSINND